MKRFTVVALALFLLCSFAGGEVVGLTGEFGDDLIFRYIAPNGQELYYVSTSENGGNVHFEDVNFDGTDDIVVLTAMGASNARYEFFVWNGSEYSLAGHSSYHGGLYNYMLLPEQKLVSVGANNGMAGAVRQDAIFKWDGMEMLCVRYAESDYEETADFEGDLYTAVVNFSILHMRIYDVLYSDTEGRQDVLIWERKIPVDAMDEAVFRDFEGIFWNGLK